MKACEKRPVVPDDMEKAADAWRRGSLNPAEKEIPSIVVGRGRHGGAKKSLDEVAYVRFASVYREFRDINEFMKRVEGTPRRKEEGQVDGEIDQPSGYEPWHERFMREALRLAERGLDSQAPTRPYGAVMVKHGRIIARIHKESRAALMPRPPAFVARGKGRALIYRQRARQCTLRLSRAATTAGLSMHRGAYSRGSRRSLSGRMTRTR